MSEQSQIWLRGKDEPTLWYDRFTIYRRLGSRRSIVATVNVERASKGQDKTDEIAGAWRINSKKYKWEERATAWDDHRRAQEEFKWEKRQEKIKEQEWDMAQKLIEKATQMLTFPLATTTRETKSVDGKTTEVTTVKPTRWGMSDAARVLKTASELARLSSNLTTSRHEITGKDGEPLISNEKYLSDNQLAEIAASAINDNDATKSEED